MLITWLLLRGARESTTANNVMVVIKLLALGLFIIVGVTHLNMANYTPFAPNGFTGIHQGAAIVFFAYIGFDAISTAAEETINPQRNLPIGILGGLAVCTVIYIIVGAVLTGMVPYTVTGRFRRPALVRAAGRRVPACRLDRGAGRGGVDVGGAAGVPVRASRGSSSRWRAMGCFPQWAAKVHPVSRIPYTTTLLTGVLVALASLVGDAAETYDLTNIGTLFAFALVSIGVVVLRVTEPERPRPFKVPFVWPVRHPGDRVVRVRDGRFAETGVGALRHLAGDRAGAVLLLRLLTLADQGPVGRSACGLAGARSRGGARKAGGAL